MKQTKRRRRRRRRKRGKNGESKQHPAVAWGRARKERWREKARRNYAAIASYSQRSNAAATSNFCRVFHCKRLTVAWALLFLAVALRHNQPMFSSASCNCSPEKKRWRRVESDKNTQRNDDGRRDWRRYVKNGTKNLGNARHAAARRTWLCADLHHSRTALCDVTTTRHPSTGNPPPRHRTPPIRRSSNQMLLSTHPIDRCMPSTQLVYN